MLPCGSCPAPSAPGPFLYRQLIIRSTQGAADGLGDRGDITQRRSEAARIHAQAGKRCPRRLTRQGDLDGILQHRRRRSRVILSYRTDERYHQINLNKRGGSDVKVCRLSIANFRGVKSATVLLPNHAVLIGDNNTGKTTLLEALDLVLGPDRLNRQPPIDEHDFFQGKYLAKAADAGGEDAEDEGADAQPDVVQPEAAGEGGAGETAAAVVGEDAPRIEIEVAIADLTEEQKAKFGDYTEFWDAATDTFYQEANPAGVDAAHITEALRVTFHGWYDPEEDDFEGRTYFTRSLTESDTPVPFSKKDKQVCGFL